MTKLRPPLYCCHCKKISEKSEDFFFVEEGIRRAFCSEQCIDAFYSFVVEHFANWEKGKREELKLKDEKAYEYRKIARYLDETLRKPDEIYREMNELGEMIHFFIRELTDESNEPFYLIIAAFVIEHAPSYIILTTATAHHRLLEEFRKGESLDITPFIVTIGDSMKPVMEISNDLIGHLEFKKSSLLADLLEHRQDTDIAIENYPLYQEFFTDTLEKADEIYVMKEDGDEVFTYIKTHSSGTISFYYIVFAIKPGEHWNERSALPFFSFPTLDVKLRNHFRQGKKLLGTLLS